jgi:hypothetical protein
MNNYQNIQYTLQQYHHLIQMAEQFLSEYDDGNGRRASDVSIDEDGNILYKKNTACHCHPEYETFEISSTTFSEWLNKQQTNE